MSEQVIAIASLKGGVGKTTTAVSLATGLANFAPVLLADFDPQGQVALHLGLPDAPGVYRWIVDDRPLAECLEQARPAGLTVLPGNSLTKTVQRLHAGESEFAALKTKVRAAMPGTLVVDTAAGGLLQELALTVADQVVIPFRPEVPSIDSAYNSLEVVRQLAPNAAITLLPVALDIRLREHRNNLASLAADLASHDYGLAETYAIRARIAVAEAVASGQSIWEYRHASLADVRVGYSYLVARVMRLAGKELPHDVWLEGMSHGTS